MSTTQRRPAGVALEADEIEVVTKEMTRAGVHELAGFSPEMDDPAEIVTAIYRAMVKAKASVTNS